MTNSLAPRGIAARLIDLETESGATELARFAGGLSLAACFGAAIGARSGAASMFAHAAGVPLAPLATALVGGPAFYVALAHAGLHIGPRALAGAVTRGTAVSGLVLAGLAPAMGLLSVSCESDFMVRAYAVLGLATGGAMGLRAMFGDLSRHQRPSGLAERLPRLVFAAFTCVFCARIWSGALPILGGGQ
jgi:hypothetical protein